MQLLNLQRATVAVLGVKVPQLLITALWGFGIGSLVSRSEPWTVVWGTYFILGCVASMAGVASDLRLNRIGVVALVLSVLACVGPAIADGILGDGWARGSSEDRGLIVVVAIFFPVCIALGIWLKPENAAHRGQRAVAWAALAMALMTIVADGYAVLFTATASTPPAFLWDADAAGVGANWLQHPVDQLLETLAAWPSSSLMAAPFAFLSLAWSDSNRALGRPSRLLPTIGKVAVVLVAGNAVGMLGLGLAAAAKIQEPDRGLLVLLGCVLGYVIAGVVIWQRKKPRGASPAAARRGGATLPSDIARAVAAMRDSGA